MSQNILDQIIEHKRAEVAQQKQHTSIDHFKETIVSMPRCRNFYAAVTKPNKRGLNVIAEIKKASPSAGIIRPDFDALHIALTYAKCGADAISVLTDEKYFQGSLDYIAEVKDAVDIPILRKDFIIDPWQVYESRAAGADAILLIAEALPSGLLMDLMIAASELTLTVLLEVHSMEKLLEVRSLLGFPKKGSNVLGINNRDLTTMKVDLNTTSRLAELMDGKGDLVTESGIKTRADVEKMIQIGVRAILIGETLCRCDDIGHKFGELFG
ncbi:MAG: indole-3-glycerol phosphate synthase TrpC [Phycisphaerae bacterium]|nr:indole-3-glycerol phosphate synthase TrpC [Phycisphaerae bacterium]